jgi:polar amino acid transport system substrate-binding protein
VRHTKTLAGTAALTLALALAACGSDSSDSSSGDKLADLKDKGTITVAFAGEEPYSFEKDGELTGATIALHKKIFKDMGIKEVKGVKTEWNALIPGLKAGRYDAISAGMSILPDRCKEASFGDPEILYTTALMVPEGNPKNLKNLDDVKKSGAKLATMSGAIETDYAKSLDIEATQVKSPQDGMDAVARGSSDVFALTGISLRTMDENNPDVKVEVTDSFVAVVDGKEQVGAGATVFKKGDDTLRDAYNKELAKITGDEKAYTDVIGEFGFTDAERPKGDLTTEQLCKGELPDAK